MKVATQQFEGLGLDTNNLSIRIDDEMVSVTEAT
jgi:hypothetical protein